MRKFLSTTSQQSTYCYFQNYGFFHSQQFVIKMRIFELIKTAVHQADFFSTTQLIRYQQEPQFKTLTGGIFSLMIMILLGTIFFNMSLSAVRRENINWAGQTAKDGTPSKLELNFSTFNIGVQLAGYNLSATIQYFDVIMTLYSFQNKQLQNGGTRIPMTMCRRQDWAINDDILGNFDRMNATNWLCPDVTSSFFIQGKWTSDNFTYLSVDVFDCGTVNKNAVCANKSQIDRALQNIMHFSIYYINALVSPNSQQPISYYLQDKDYVYFGKKNGGANYIFISDYQITTDHSIFPFSDNRYKSGGIVMLPTRISVQEVANGWYARFAFRKAVDRYVYTRNFTKFDSVVSYTGGLFGALIGVLFLMNHYTRISFQIALGSKIYKDDADDSEAGQPNYINLLRYVKYNVYRLLLFIGYLPDWKMQQRFEKCRVQIQKHLDIKFMLDKLNFMQRAIFAICGEQKYKALHLRNKVTIKDAEKFRQHYFLKSLIINSMLKSKKQKKESSQQNQVQSPNAIFSQKTPFFNYRKGKVMPIYPSNGIQQVSENKDIIQKEQNLSESLQTHKFTRKTRRHIEQMKSYLSSMKSVEIDSPAVQVGELANALQQIKREGENGDNLSKQIWNSLDNDIKLIIQHKMSMFGQDIILERDDISNSAHQTL